MLEDPSNFEFPLAVAGVHYPKKVRAKECNQELGADNPPVNLSKFPLNPVPDGCINPNHLFGGSHENVYHFLLDVLVPLGLSFLSLSPRRRP